ncbi:MAG: DUF58 domain-containing protein, partial [Victivallaceae bacterium]|nr:DUF58 domain-containing protein [Victivallaceae bacterium]
MGLDLEFLNRVVDLELPGGRCADGVLAGVHPSRRRGNSPEFKEFRVYGIGDSPREIDWRLSARRDDLQIRLHTDETRLSCRIVLDCSRSLDFQGENAKRTKFELAQMMAAAFIVIGGRQNDSTGLTLLGEKRLNFFPASATVDHRQRQLDAVAKARPVEKGCALADELGRLAESAPRHSLAVAVSDFYVAPDGLRPQLAALAAREVRCLLLRVLDPAETALEWRDPVVAVDLETGVELEVRPD